MLDRANGLIEEKGTKRMSGEKEIAALNADSSKGVDSSQADGESTILKNSDLTREEILQNEFADVLNQAKELQKALIVQSQLFEEVNKKSKNILDIFKP